MVINLLFLYVLFGMLYHITVDMRLCTPYPGKIVLLCIPYVRWTMIPEKVLFCVDEVVNIYSFVFLVFMGI